MFVVYWKNNVFVYYAGLLDVEMIYAMPLHIWTKLHIIIASTYKLNEFGIFWEPNMRMKSRTLYMTTAPLWMR
ncbi:hypothetical protein GIB67_020624, partial [Kingdonia uniflora]